MWIFLILTGLSTAYSKPTLGLYYESLDPYSRKFIREEVWPVFQSSGEGFDVKFIAYGNAVAAGSIESGFAISCQHGERECAGNIVQACTEGEEGRELHYKNGEELNNLTPGAYSVPW